MPLQRIFYVTQNAMSVWEVRDRVPRQIEVFAEDEQGLRRFEEYIARSSSLASAFLVDVIEEEFKLQHIPKLTWRDRRNLIERRCAAAFRRTTYRASLFQGKSSKGHDEYTVVHSAIVNHELVDNWMQIALQHCTPIRGVYSVPHLAQNAAKRLFAEKANCLFVAPHQGNKLRQVFMQNGKLRSARLSQSPTADERQFSEAVIAEVGRSRRYFERTRLLSPIDQLEVRVIADTDTAEQISALARADSSTTYEFVDPDGAAKKLGLRGSLTENHFEAAYFAMLARSQPSTSYATSGETRYWYMQTMRKVAIASCVAVATVCSALGSALMTDTWLLRSEAAEIQAQVQQLSETYRRENDRLDPIKADSYEMKLAVDSGDHILANRVPVPWVMNQLSVVLADFSDVQPQGLQWSIESPPQPERRQRPGEQALPVPVPVVNAVDATVTATLASFDGDMRKAFTRIDELASALQANTHFQSARVVDYPIDTNTGATVSGELSKQQARESISFRIQVSYRLIPSNENNTDEPI